MCMLFCGEEAATVLLLTQAVMQGLVQAPCSGLPADPGLQQLLGLLGLWLPLASSLREKPCQRISEQAIDLFLLGSILALSQHLSLCAHKSRLPLGKEQSQGCSQLQIWPYVVLLLFKELLQDGRIKGMYTID